MLFEAAIFDTSTSSLGQLFSEYDFNLYHLPGKDNFAADALSRRPDIVIANDIPSLSAQELKLQCSRTLQDTVNRLNVLRLPHHNSSLPTLHPLRTTNIAGDSEIIALVKEEAQLDLEYLSVTRAATDRFHRKRRSYVVHT